ncbi:DNA glycosylase [Cladochytrium replicatum]|nr:DNA glycosylase [Cladochytrium replicatum]
MLRRSQRVANNIAPHLQDHINAHLRVKKRTAQFSTEQSAVKKRKGTEAAKLGSAKPQKNESSVTQSFKQTDEDHTTTIIGTTVQVVPNLRQNPSYEEMKAHVLRSDPKMADLMARCNNLECLPLLPRPDDHAESLDVFAALATSILYQQIHGKAAQAILKRFVGLFTDCDQSTGSRSSENSLATVTVGTEGGPVDAIAEKDMTAKEKAIHYHKERKERMLRSGFPQPEKVAAASIEQLRSAGLSQRKAEYVRELAQHFADGRLSSRELIKMEDEQILEKLCAIRGIGVWTVQMFLIFDLGRPNILPVGDLGVQKGMGIHFNMKGGASKKKSGKYYLPNATEMEEAAECWRPYATFGSYFMWRVADLAGK